MFEASDSLGELVERLEAALRPLERLFEILLVNDGSRDGSWATMEQIARRHSAVRGIDLFRNYGQHSALPCGIRAARYPVTVTLDDDLHHPPEEVPRLLAPLGGLWRGLASRLTKRALGFSTGVVQREA